MPKFNEIKKFIIEDMSPIIPNVPIYYGNAPETATLPYAVFEVRETSHEGITNYGNIEINFFYNNEDSTNFDNKIDAIQNSLNACNYTTKRLNLHIYLGGRNLERNRKKDIMNTRLKFNINYIYYGGELHGKKNG